MKWSYDLAGAEPIIKDEIVYDSTVIANGEYLMLGTTAFTSGADAGYACVNAVVSTVATAVGLNGVGISLQTITTSGNGMFYSGNAPQSVATACNSTAGAQLGLNTTTSFAYAKTIINPLAVYRTQVGAGAFNTADTLAIASSATTNQIAVTGVPASAFDGSWVYFAATAGPNFGQLRKVVSSATAGTQQLDIACLNTITTADRVIIFSERNKNPHRVSSTSVTTANTNLGTTIGMTTVGGFTYTNFRVLENWIDGGTFGGGGTELRYERSGQMNPGTYGGNPLTASKTIKFWQDVISLSHAFKG